MFVYLRIPIYTDIGPSLQKQSFCTQTPYKALRAKTLFLQVQAL